MTSNWSRLHDDILATDLYSRSGTEVGVSEGTLRLVEHEGDYQVERAGAVDVPDAVLASSPDRECDYPLLARATFGKEVEDFLVGEHKKIFVGYHTDPAVRRNAASAGITTGIQLYLLGTKQADGAVTMRMDSEKPYLTKPFIAHTKEDVLRGAQSKYTIAPLNHILAELPGNYHSLVYTGLPHEVAAIRKLQLLGHKSVAPVSLVLGIFYGETIGFSAIQSLLRAHGVRNVTEVRSLEFRAGEWPGHLRIELKSGRTITVRKLHANYLIPSHITPFSLYQVDYMNELADISVGDAWAPTYEKRGEGWSVVVARSEKGLKIIQEMRSKGLLSMKEISREELIAMHSHGLDLKKRGAFIRIARRRMKGLPVPEYGYAPVNIPRGRYLFESLLSLLFIIFRSRPMVWTLEKLPVPFIGWFFVRARNIWKRTTRSTKKGGLHTLAFRRGRGVVNPFGIEDVRAFWDDVSAIYEPANKKVGYVHYQRFEKAVEYADFAPGQRVLNIWSRTGNLIPYLRKIPDLEVVNREVSPRMMAIAKERYRDERFALTDLTDLSEFPDAYFDKIISLETLEHTPLPSVFLKELRRVLRPGGKLIMSLPPRGFEWPTRIYDALFHNHGEGPHQFLSPRDVRPLLKEAGFSLEAHHPFIIFPLGSDVLERLGEKVLTGLFGKTPLANAGVRHFYIARA